MVRPEGSAVRPEGSAVVPTGRRAHSASHKKRKVCESAYMVAGGAWPRDEPTIPSSLPNPATEQKIKIKKNSQRVEFPSKERGRDGETDETDRDTANNFLPRAIEITRSLQVL